ARRNPSEVDPKAVYATISSGRPHLPRGQVASTSSPLAPDVHPANWCALPPDTAHAIWREPLAPRYRPVECGAYRKKTRMPRTRRGEVLDRTADDGGG